MIMATGVGPSCSASAQKRSHELGENDLKVVYNALHPMAEKYLFFGIQIDVKMSEIKKIQRLNTNPNECLLEVLSIRLKQIPSLTWNDIHTALVSESVGEVKLADEIKKKYGHLFSPDPSCSQAALEEESGSFILEKGITKRRSASRRKHGTQVSTEDSAEEISEGGYESKRYKKSSKGKKRCHPLKKGGIKQGKYFGRFAKKRSKQDKKVTEREVVHEKEVSSSGSEAGVDSEGIIKETKMQTKPRVSPTEKQRKDESESSEASSENEIGKSVCLSQNQQVEMKRKRKGRDIRRKSKCQRKKGKRIGQESSSSSSEIDDSSPECDINFSETETKELRKVFRCFFGKLCCVIKDPVETAAELQAKRAISQSTMESILRSPESNQEKAIALVKALEKRIKCRPDRIFTIIGVFQQNKLLENTGREMWIKTGK